MKIARFISPAGDIEVGVVEDGCVRLLASSRDDGAAPFDVLDHIGSRAADDAPRYQLEDLQLLSPIVPRRNIFAVGLNYQEHIEESLGQTLAGSPVRGVPMFFTKATGSVVGPSQPVVADPAISTHFDWEAELAVVIGRHGRDIPIEDALSYVAGYTIGDDVSARDIQERHGQWFKGKSIDTTCPLGPWLVTADEVGDPQRLGIELRVNGVVKQRASTAQMIISTAELISLLSRGMTLQPGDVLLTGTPAGVGFTREPPEFLQPGDVVEIDVERIGTLRHGVVLQTGSDPVVGTLAGAGES